jgi:hypothetical protein
VGSPLPSKLSPYARDKNVTPDKMFKEPESFRTPTNHDGNSRKIENEILCYN